MDVAVTAMLGVSDPFGRILVMPGLLHAPASLIRPQVNTRATSLRPDGLAWEEQAADTPRFPGPATRLLIEGQRTNQVRNPRCEGAIPGLPGTMPTNWVPQAPSGGLQRQVVGTGAEGGIQYIDLRLFGTTTGANAQWRVDLLPVNQASAAQGQTWTSSMFVRLVAGSIPGGVSASLFVQEFNSSGGQLQQSAVSFAAVSAAPLASQRFSHTRTLTDAATAFVAAPFFFNVPTAGTVVDFTIRIGFPQLEQGSFASTPILPPSGTPGASTRGTDILTAPLAALGIGGNGACTVLWTSQHAVAGTANFFEVLLEINNGTINNRVTIVRSANSSSIIFERTTGGVQASVLGSYTPGNVTRFGLSLAGTGGASLSIDGAAPLVLTGTPVSGLTTLRLGTDTLGGGPFFGTYGLVRCLPRVLSDSDLQAAVAAL
jgi:hypothetical protein